MLTVKKISSIIVSILIIISFSGFSQSSIKNVIFLIPDGTSSDLLAFARWYNGNTPNALDEIICGMVKTHSIDSTMADSAPAGTAFATGHKTKSGYVGVTIDSVPKVSVLELARLKGLSTGIVVTCQFPHATPADFVCHYPKRDDMRTLSKQFLYNSPDIVFGGGYKYLTDNNLIRISDSLNIHIIKNYIDFKGFNFSQQVNEPVWALFNDWKKEQKYLSYNCDRNPDEEPSLSEMTHKAIEYLSKNKKGFFLMVEGSQVDWAAHFNDPKAIVTDFIEFDNTVKVALDFAKKDGNTIVIVCPDHGNGGISLGNSYTGDISNNPKKYDKLSIPHNIINPLKEANHSSRWVIEKINKHIDTTGFVDLDNNALTKFIEKEYAVVLTEKELNNILSPLKFCKLNFKGDSKKLTDSTNKAIVMLGHKLSRNSYIGWTSTGHTGEDVFLGIYHPNNDRLTGIVDNTDIGKYIAKQLNLGDLQTSSNSYFKPISGKSTFNNWKISTERPLKFKKDKKTLSIYSNTNFYSIDGINYPLKTLVVNIGDYYYIPEELYQMLNE